MASVIIRSRRARVTLSLAGFAVALLGIGGFIWWSLRIEHPMLDLRLFRLPIFRASMIGGTLSSDLGDYGMKLPGAKSGVRLPCGCAAP